MVKPIKQFRAIYIKSNIKKNALFIYHHQRFLPKNLPATAFFFTRKDQNKSDFSSRKKAVVLHFLRSLLWEIRITWHMDFNVFVKSRETNIISYIGMSATSNMITALPIPLDIWFNLHSFQLFWKLCRYVFLKRLLYNPFFWVHDKYISNVTFYRWRIWGGPNSFPTAL